MVYAPGLFTLQARTGLAIRADGITSQATVFTALVAQDHTIANSSVVN